MTGSARCPLCNARQRNGMDPGWQDKTMSDLFRALESHYGETKKQKPLSNAGLPGRALRAVYEYLEGKTYLRPPVPAGDPCTMVSEALIRSLKSKNAGPKTIGYILTFLQRSP